MPAKSKSQQRAAGMALAAKRGEMDVSELQGAAKEMYDSMTKKELEDYAETEHEGLPDKVNNESKGTIKLKDLIKENRGIVHPVVIGNPVNSNTSMDEKYLGSARQLGREDFENGYIVITRYTEPDSTVDIGITIGTGYEETELYLSESEFSKLHNLIMKLD